jgi:hypothetical protein
MANASYSCSVCKLKCLDTFPIYTNQMGFGGVHTWPFPDLLEANGIRRVTHVTEWLGNGQVLTQSLEKVCVWYEQDWQHLTTTKFGIFYILKFHIFLHFDILSRSAALSSPYITAKERSNMTTFSILLWVRSAYYHRWSMLLFLASLQCKPLPTFS